MHHPAGVPLGESTHASVRYEDVYEGVDVRYYGNGGQLEYDFIVAAGADASQLRLRFDGVDHLEITAEGDLLLAGAWLGTRGSGSSAEHPPAQ